MPLSIKEEEQPSETVREFPVLYDIAAKGYKEKDAGKAATRSVLCKKVFIEILQNSQENTCARASF